MEQKEQANKKNYLAVLLIVILVVLGYLAFFSGDSGNKATDYNSSRSNKSFEADTGDLDGDSDETDSDAEVAGDPIPGIDITEDQAGDEEAIDDDSDDDSIPAEGEIDEEEPLVSGVTFNISGRNFAFDQEVITVKQGDVVTINFTSEDGVHDWTVDEFDAATATVSTGGTSGVSFLADQTGEFEFYCSVGSHREMGMTGKLIVE